MQKLDLRKTLRHLYQPSARKVELIDVPAFQFLMVDGHIKKGKTPGDSPSFVEAVQALFGASHTLSFSPSSGRKTPSTIRSWRSRRSGGSTTVISS